MTKISITLLVLLLASPAWANRTTGPGATGRTVSAITPTGLRTAFYDFSNTTDSPILAVGSCATVDVIFNSDTTTAAYSVVEGNVRTCVSSTASTNTCNPVYSDAGAVTLNGNPTTGRAAIYGISAGWIYFDVTANGGTDAARVLAICNE